MRLNGRRNGQSTRNPTEERELLPTVRAKDIVIGKLGFTEHHRDRSPKSNLRKSASIRGCCFLVPFCGYQDSLFSLRLCVRFSCLRVLCDLPYCANRIWQQSVGGSFTKGL